MAHLAACGGIPVRTKPFPKWPIWDHREEEALLGALRRGQWGIGSSIIEEFEKKFASVCGTKHAISCTNGTDAILIGLQALGVRAGDEVIIPPYTFLATATACLMCNAVPVFVDIDPDTYNLDPDLVEAAITDRTRAIVPVHIAGNPAAIDRIMSIAEKHNLRVLEDSAQAHGARFGDKMAGSIGDVGTWSFQSTKNVSSGEGGVATTNDEAVFDQLFSFQNCGRVREGQWYEHHNMSGNHRLSAFQASVLIVQLDRMEELCVRREENAVHLDSRLRDIGGVEPTRMHPGATRHAYHLYIFRY
ncbi:MAG: DegT/DnrJ/EryC1/StrS family aminotransferase, partial [bacterium]